jgi:hypothetical protein
MRLRVISGWLAGAAVLAVCAAPVSADDIIWPTYSQVSHTTDAALTCTQLHAEIDHVSSDIDLLDKARHRTQESMRTAFDLDRYVATRNQGSSTFNGNGAGEERFAKARDDIIASKKVAVARKDYLTNLLAICKNPPA